MFEMVLLYHDIMIITLLWLSLIRTPNLPEAFDNYSFLHLLVRVMFCLVIVTIKFKYYQILLDLLTIRP